MGTMAISMMAVALLLQLLLSVGYGEDLYISTAEEYLTFSRSVTSGEHIFLGETVYITDDLDFEGLRFEPPGSYSGGLNYSTSFCGSLNGNGHLIKNIRYEEGERWDVAFLAVIHGNVTFENVIVDSSCVFNNTYDHEFSSTAGVLGYASCVEGIMDIRNCVNLGGVAYSGPDESPTLGNVVAYIEDNVHVTNCVGAGWAMAKTLGFVGGLIGYSMGASVRGYAWITNCFWDINTYEQGGLGLKIATKIINFYPYNEYQQVINLDSVVSGGNNYNYNYNYNGGTDAGGDGEDDTFNDEMDVKKRLHAFNQSAPTILEFLQSSSDPSGIKYPVIRLNTMGGVELKPLLRTVVKVLPVPMREGYTFAGWYDSPTLTTPFVVTGGKGDDVAYAKWNIGTYYVRFEMNVGDGDPRIDPVAAKYNSVVSLPRPKKKNYEFEAWCRDIECSNPDTIIEVNSDMNSYANFKMPGYNVTFYPKWKASESSEKRALIIATVVCAVAVVVAVAAVIATILTYEHQRRRRTVPGMTVLPDGTITLDSGYFLASNIDLSKSTLVKALDSFPVLPDVKTLDFGPNGKLRLDSPYQLKFTIKNVSRTKLCWELFSGNVDKYTLIFNPDRGILSRNETIKVVAQITMNCTSKLEAMIPILAWEEGPDKDTKLNCKHSFIPLYAESEHSARLDPDEIKLVQPAVGEGGFGAVFKGYYKSQVVAVKVLKNQTWGGKARELVREVKLMKGLHNNYIANLIGAVTFPGKMCLVTDFVPYGNLGSLLSSGKVSRCLKARIAFDAARGIRYLHQCHIIHRDIKPENFLVESLDFMSPVCCKISDFGTAKFLEDIPSSSSKKKKKRMSARVGTPIYMAPEMLETDFYSFPSDVYSFGISLHEIYTEREPYTDLNFKHLWDITEFVIGGGRMELPEDKIPKPVASIIKKCWAQKHEKRPKIDTVVDMLKKYYADVMHEISPELEIEDEEKEAEAFGMVEQQQQQLQQQEQKQEEKSEEEENVAEPQKHKRHHSKKDKHRNEETDSIELETRHHQK